MFIVINKMRSTVHWLTECSSMHRYFQFSGCGLDEKMVRHCTQLLKWYGVCRTSWTFYVALDNNSQCCTCKHKAHYCETVQYWQTLHTDIAGTDPEMLRLSGWLLVLWLANSDRSTPIVLCANEQVKGGWLATPPPLLISPCVAY